MSEDGRGPAIPNLRMGINSAVLTILGEFDDKIPVAGDYLGMILFFMSTLFNMIVMMNLLVAIFSEVHDTFQEQRHMQRIKQYSILVQDIREILDFVECKPEDNEDENIKMLFFTTPDSTELKKAD
jgi:uncharacterized membrane protein